MLQKLKKFVTQNKNQNNNNQQPSIISILRLRVHSSLSLSKSQVTKAEIYQIQKYAQQLSRSIIQYKKIKVLAWNGIPSCIRPKIWRSLLKYTIINDERESLQRQRDKYKQLVTKYWKTSNLTTQQSKMYKTINSDVKRIGTFLNTIFLQDAIQNMLKRLLLIWHIKHPASGYVQGMCDITYPFLMVFIGQYLPIDFENVLLLSSIKSLAQDTLFAIEADVYWCMSKMMQSIISHYTTGFTGMHKVYKRLEQLLIKIDPQLYKHLKNQNIDIFSLALRNISTLLLRMLKPHVGLRLFDSYIAFKQQYPQLMIFLLIVILEKFAIVIINLKFQQLTGFLQNLPTQNWDIPDIQMVIAQAYTLKLIFGSQNIKDL